MQDMICLPMAPPCASTRSRWHGPQEGPQTWAQASESISCCFHGRQEHALHLHYLQPGFSCPRKHLLEQARASGYDSPDIALRDACPPPESRKALPGPPWNGRKCSSTSNHMHVALQGRPLACPGPEPGKPSQFLRACCTLTGRLPVLELLSPALCKQHC